MPGEECQTNPRETWSKQEKWIWNQVCQGKIADFNKIKEYGGLLNPKYNKEWPENRTIRPEFIETILLHEPYRGSLTHHGVRIVGAQFKKPLDLSFAALSYPFWLDQSLFKDEVSFYRMTAFGDISIEGSAFESKVDLAYIEVNGTLNMSRSKFTGKLLMNGIKAGHLIMSGGAEYAEVDLTLAKIDGIAEMDGSKFTAKLLMNGMNAGYLFMRGPTEYAEVNLSRAKVVGSVVMDGSKFTGKLIMAEIQAGNLFMRNGAKYTEVDLGHAKIVGHIEMDGSKFTGKLLMNGIKAGDLFMRRGAEYETEYAEVDLSVAKIGGHVEMDGSKFTGKLLMNGIKAGDLFMRRGAEYEGVDLVNAKIDGTIDMINSKFTGKLNMNGLQTADHLLMRGKAEYSEVNLDGAEIGGLLDMSGSTFNGKLSMISIKTMSHLLMLWGAFFGKPVTLTFSKIGRNLELRDSTLSGLDLTGTKVGGEFALGPPATLWSEDAKLILRGTEVYNLQLQNLPKAWPDKLELTGFTYACLGGTNLKIELSWLKDWLEKQKKYSPQPYTQLAKVLRNEGHPDKADKLLYVGKNRELSEIEGLSDWIWLASLKVFIGYGYRIYYAIYWVLGLVSVGVFVLKISRQGSVQGMPYGIAYSLDMLLPIIRLRECHYDIDLAGWARYYFYLHKFMGYILVSFLIAGLSGLTK